MRISYEANELCHSFFVKRVLRAYKKKIAKRLSHRPELDVPVDLEVTQKHLELYGKLGLPCCDKWLRMYSNMTGVVDYRYLPEDLFFARIERVLNNCDHDNFEDKNLLMKIVDKQYLPKTYVRYIRGLFFDEDYNFLSIEQVNQVITQNNGNLIGKKAVESSGGRGVQMFKYNNGHYASSECELLTADWIKSQAESYIIQEALQQCDFGALFNPHSTNTCRITTLRCPWNGEVVVPKAAMRFGITEAAIDNASAGGISVGLSRKGELGSYAYCYYKLKQYKEHPSSHVVFEGKVHPYYQKMCDVVIGFAKKIPDFNLMSWDVITDKDENVRIIEVNLTSQGTDVQQFAFGSFFGEYTEPLIDWVAQHKDLDSFRHLRTF